MKDALILSHHIAVDKYMQSQSTQASPQVGFKWVQIYTSKPRFGSIGLSSFLGFVEGLMK